MPNTKVMKATKRDHRRICGVRGQQRKTMGVSFRDGAGAGLADTYQGSNICVTHDTGVLACLRYVVESA